MGLTVLDAGVLIALLDASDAHHRAAVEALQTARERRDRLVVPASAYAECLVGPSRRGTDAVAVVEELIEALPATVEPITRAIAREAATLRARPGAAVRLPDALVLATAEALGADRVITTDAQWRTVGRHVDLLAP